jgi:hypothetical protein
MPRVHVALGNVPGGQWKYKAWGNRVLARLEIEETGDVLFSVTFDDLPALRKALEAAEENSGG